MRRAILACKVIEAELRLLISDSDIELRFMEQGLHRHPDHLRESLQAEIDSIDADEILLGYGSCGNGVIGLKSDRARLIVPRVDDCISMLLGSFQRYRTEFESEPGTYWLSNGWIEHASDPYKEYERVREKYDEETARWVAHETMKGYHRLALIETEADLPEERRQYERDFANFFELRYEELRGTQSLFEEFLANEHDPDGFVIVEPGEEITSAMFLPSLGLPNG